MILDIIIVAFIAILVIVGIKRGIAATLLNLLSVAAAGLLAYIGSKLVAGWIYSAFISRTVTESVSETVSNSAQNAEIISQEAIDNLPDFIKGLLSAFGIQTDAFNDSAAQAVQNNSDALAKTVDDTISPVVISVLSVVLLVVMFIVFLIICKFIARRLVRLFDLPVISAVNRLLGGTLGFLEGAAICLVAILACRVLLPYTAEPLITPEMIDQSIIFKAVYYSDFMNSAAMIFGAGNDTIDTVVEQATQASSQPTTVE